MKVKFELSQGGHIDIPVYVNDEGPFRFKVDTGAAATALTQSLVEKLDIQTSLDETGKFDAIGFSYEIAELDNLTIESIVREKEEVIVFDMDSFLASLGAVAQRISGNIGHTVSKRGNFTPYGILGASFFNRYELVIDYPMMNLALL